MACGIVFVPVRVNPIRDKKKHFQLYTPGPVWLQINLVGVELFLIKMLQLGELLIFSFCKILICGRHAEISTMTPTQPKLTCLSTQIKFIGGLHASINNYFLAKEKFVCIWNI
jgi:hypothetical protein